VKLALVAGEAFLADQCDLRIEVRAGQGDRARYLVVGSRAGQEVGDRRRSTDRVEYPRRVGELAVTVEDIARVRDVLWRAAGS